MPWLPSHQNLREHPKLHKFARLLGINRAQAIGHLHLLWWWTLSYAPDGDLSSFDVTDLAIAAEWEGDADKFVAALIDCGSGERSGFIDRESYTLHDWLEYGGRYQQQSSSGEIGNHIRWHVQRDRVEVDCPFCIAPESGANPPRLAPDIGGDRNPNPEEKREEKKKLLRARAMPDDWQPSAEHQALASELGVSASSEAEHFKDFHASKGSTFKDWDAAFRTWLRNAAKFQAERAPKNSNGVGFHVAPGAAPA